jgi:hypothetical protein
MIAQYLQLRGIDPSVDPVRYLRTGYRTSTGNCGD